ncbi:MAG: energy transducer TonB [Gallionella sp.]
MPELILNPTIIFPRSNFSVRGGALQVQRMLVVLVVLVLHATLAGIWLFLPVRLEPAIKEMSVSVALAQPPVLSSQPQLLSRMDKPSVDHPDKPVSKTVMREVSDAAPQVAPLAESSAPEVAAAIQPPATAPVADIEPDYKAQYLNNPRPTYPLIARKMAWEGRVLLNVEVLAEGTCGAISILNSSGREALDSAAIKTVKGWHFSPARQGGRAITKWFKVPIDFSFEE